MAEPLEHSDPRPGALGSRTALGVRADDDVRRRENRETRALRRDRQPLPPARPSAAAPRGGTDDAVLASPIPFSSASGAAGIISGVDTVTR